MGLQFLESLLFFRRNVFRITRSLTTRNSNTVIRAAFAALWSAELDFVHHGVKAVIMRTQGVQNFPNHLKAVIVIQGVFRLFASRNNHRNNDVAILFARSRAHHTSHALHHIHFAIAGTQKENRIQARHVHAFTQAAHVIQNATFAIFRIGLEPSQAFFTLGRPHRPVNMHGRNTHRILLGFRF